MVKKKKEKEISQEDVVKLLNKKFGSDIIQPAVAMKGLKVERISTGSISVDVETGGGLPKGRLVEIYGKESSGKTYVSLKTVAEAQKEGRKVLWIDAEGVFDAEWAKKLKVNLELLEIAKPETLEQTGTILDAATRSRKYSVIVLDSVAALLPEEDLIKSMDEHERMGNRAILMNRTVRKLQSALNTTEDGKKNDTLLIFINQIREKIGIMYGNPETTTGGLGIRFCASIRLELRRSELIKEKDQVIGVTIKFKTAKNKTFTPLKKGQFIIYTTGEKAGQIDRVDEIFRYGIISGVIEHSGKTYIIDGHKLLGQENARAYLRENPKLIDKLYKELQRVYK